MNWTILLVFIVLIGCDYKKSKKAYCFDTQRNSAKIIYEEEIIMSDKVNVSYSFRPDFQAVFAREKMEQTRITKGMNRKSQNQFFYTLNKDEMKSIVHYVDGVHFSVDGKITVKKSPLEGKTLYSELTTNGWSQFVLFSETNMSSKIILALKKMNDNFLINNSFSLDKKFYPREMVSLGKTWTVNNCVTNSTGIFKGIYTITFKDVVKHRGLSCAKLNIHSVFCEANKRFLLDLRGTSYYSFKYALELDLKTKGKIEHYSDHRFEGKTMRRKLVGECSIVVKNTILFENPNEEQISEFERAKVEFKGNPGNRTAAAETLRPYLAVGMSKDDIAEILGDPSKRHSKHNTWFYGLFWGQFITVEFDEQGRVKRVGPSDQSRNE